MSSTKKKLLIASDCFLPRWDGIARFLSETVPDLAKKYDVTIVVPDFPGKKPKGWNIPTIYLPLSTVKFGDYTTPTFQFNRIKKEVKKTDIVFTQTIGPIGSLAVRYAKKYKKPLLCYIHSVEWELVPKSLKRFHHLAETGTRAFCKYIYNKASLLLVPSKDTADKLEEIGITTRKHLVYAGVNTATFCPAGNKEKAKKTAHVPSEKIIIGFSGRVAREKDLPTLYEAFRKLQTRYGNLSLMIVGSGLPLEEVFPSTTDIIHIPHANDVQRYLQAMDIYVMPSLTETSSLSTLEAMSCGIPVIATHVGHIKYYITNEKNGFFFPKGDVPYLVKKLAKLIENEDLRKAMGGYGRKTVVSKYSWDKTVQELIEELDGV